MNLTINPYRNAILNSTNDADPLFGTRKRKNNKTNQPKQTNISNKNIYDVLSLSDSEKTEQPNKDESSSSKIPIESSEKMTKSFSSLSIVSDDNASIMTSSTGQSDTRSIDTDAASEAYRAYKIVKPLKIYKDNIFRLIDRIKEKSGVRFKYIFKPFSEWKFKENAPQKQSKSLSEDVLDDLETLQKENRMLPFLNTLRHSNIEGSHRISKMISNWQKKELSSSQRAKLELVEAKTLNRLGEDIQTIIETARSAYTSDPNLNNQYYLATRLTDPRATEEQKKEGAQLLDDILKRDPNKFSDPNDTVAFIQAKLMLANRLNKDTGKRGNVNREEEATTALQLARSLPNYIKGKPQLCAQAYESIGGAHMDKKDYTKAREHFRKALAVEGAFDSAADSFLEARIRKQVAMTHSFTKNRDEAYNEGKQAWECYQKIPPTGYDTDHAEKIWILYGLGHNCKDQNEAVAYLKEALESAKQNNNKNALWQIHDKLGIRSPQREHKLCIDHFKEAFEILQPTAPGILDTKLGEDLAFIAIRIAKHLSNLGNQEEARQYLDKVKQYTERPYMKAQYNMAYAETYPEDLVTQIEYRQLAHQGAQAIPLPPDKIKELQKIEPALASNLITYGKMLSARLALPYYQEVANLPYATPGQRNAAQSRIQSIQRKK